MTAMKPDCPTLSVDVFANVIFPVAVSTKFWWALKSKVTLPVLVASTSVSPTAAPPNVVTRVSAMDIAGVVPTVLPNPITKSSALSSSAI